jgi:FkbM family methyltransferase
LVEPNIGTFQKLKENRPNNKLFNNIISDQKKEYTFQFLSKIDLVGGITETLPEKHLDFWYNEYKNKYNHSIESFQMEAIFLTDVIKQTDFTHIDFFSLDVEGHEFEILNSWDFSIPIYLILLETLDRDEDEINTSEKCKSLLVSKGYKDCGKLAHNTVFILKGCYLDE